MYKIYSLVILATALQACGLMGAMRQADEHRNFQKDKQVLYSSRDLKTHPKFHVTRIVLDTQSRFHIKTYPTNGAHEITGSFKTQDKESSAKFYQLDKAPSSWKANWVMYHPKNKQLVTFYSDAKSPEKFNIKRRDIQFTAGGNKLSKGMSKGKAVKELNAVRLRIEAQKKEEQRIQDSIREANTLKGKDVASLKIISTKSADGVGGSIGFGIVAKLKNGRELKTRNLSGGLTDLSEFEYSSDFGTAGQGQISLPSSLSQFTKKEVKITVKSKFQSISTNETLPIYFLQSMNIDAKGENGGSGSSGSSGSRNDPNGRDGKDGRPGGSGGQVELILKKVSSSAGQDLVEAKAYVNGNLVKTEYLETEAKIEINAKGGNGGSGGRGGNGWDASINNCRAPQTLAGGRGGNGGNGAPGGNGGTVTIRYNGTRVKVSAYVEGGKGGNGGRGGDGGNDGECVRTGSKDGQTLYGSKRSTNKQADGRDGNSSSAGSAGRIIEQ